MGAGASVSANNTKTSITNDVFQKSESECIAECSNLQENIVIVINDGSVIGGDLILDQSCLANALCTMITDLESITQQTTVTNQEADSDVGLNWFQMGFAGAVNNSSTSVHNTTTQIISSLCKATAENVQENITILINGGSRIVGDVQLQQSGNATANCAIESTASATVVQDTTTDQTAKATTGIDLYALLLILVGGGIAIAVVNTANQKKGDDKKKSTQMSSLMAT